MNGFLKVNLTNYVNFMTMILSSCSKLAILVWWLLASYVDKLTMLETEKDIYQKLSGAKRDKNIGVDGEMCNILIAETNKLKGEVNNLSQTLGWKENETKQLKTKIRELSSDLMSNVEAMEKYKSEVQRFEKLAKGEERLEFQVSEFTPKTTLRKYVDELNQECGMSERRNWVD